MILSFYNIDQFDAIDIINVNTTQPRPARQNHANGPIPPGYHWAPTVVQFLPHDWAIEVFLWGRYTFLGTINL